MNDTTRELPDGGNDRARVTGVPSTGYGDGVTVITSSPHDDAHKGMRGNEAAALPVGSRLAEFEITALVGQGGFGTVYEARDHALERIVAIKEYLPVSLSMRRGDGTVQPVSQQQRDTFELGMRSFINEARLLAQFDHPSLLKVYRFWQERGTAYMAMPFYRGPTLRQALAEIPGGASENFLLRIVDDLTQALMVMHRANCYHRDIAPDNILLLEDSNRPVLLDFGAARRVISDKTQAITTILKPGYAPIEQYAEMPDTPQGAWTDVYALAAVLHVAVTGQTPPPSVARLLADGYAPLAADAQLQKRFSARLLAAIDAGLAVRPQARPQSVAAFRELLGLSANAAIPPLTSFPTVLRAEPAIVPPAGKTVLAAPHGKGKGLRRAAAMAVLALLLAAGLGWWLLRGGETPGGKTAKNLLQDPAMHKTAPVTAQAEPSPPPRTPAESLAALAEGAASGFNVSATPRQQTVRVGQDRLDFEIHSSRAGYVYIYLLSTNGDLLLLFPNLLDKYNRIEAGQTITLPRPAWPLEAEGPPGADRFVALVSEHERDFAGSGLRSADVFSDFPLPVLAALEAVRGSGPPPLLGKPVCAPGEPCQDAYGVGTFEIIER